MSGFFPPRPPPRESPTPVQTTEVVEPRADSLTSPNLNQGGDLGKNQGSAGGSHQKEKRKGHNDEGDQEKRRKKGRRNSKDDDLTLAEASTHSKDLGTNVAADVLRDPAVQKAIRASVNKHAKALAEDLWDENTELKEAVEKLEGTVTKQAEENAQMASEITALRAELSALKAKRSPPELKGSTVRFCNKVLLSRTFGDEFSTIVRRSNEAWGHDVFGELRDLLPPSERDRYAPYYHNPSARRSFEEAVHTFRRGGVEKLQPSVLDFLYAHPDFPSASEVDNYADDLDSSLLGEFVLQQPEPSANEAREGGGLQQTGGTAEEMGEDDHGDKEKECEEDGTRKNV